MKSSPQRKKAVAVDGMVLRVAELARLPWLVHGFSTRTGGVSILGNGRRAGASGAAGTEDLNLGNVAWDKPRNVAENRRRLLARLQAEEMRLVVLRQVHSDLIRVVEDAAPAAGDGMVTDRSGFLLAILAADCLPVLLADTRQRAVAALHCGWRGTVRRIAQKGVGLMKQRFGSREADLLAAIGPGIRACCYRVGEEVREEFEGQFRYGADLFLPCADTATPLQKKYPLLFHHNPESLAASSKQQAFLDLAEANVRQLREAGVQAKHIYADAPCTHCHPEQFFSHRRDGSASGRMMGVIGIRVP